MIGLSTTIHAYDVSTAFKIATDKKDVSYIVNALSSKDIIKEQSITFTKSPPLSMPPSAPPHPPPPTHYPPPRLAVENE